MGIAVPSSELGYRVTHLSVSSERLNDPRRNPASRIARGIFAAVQEVKSRRTVENVSARVIVYEGVDEIGMPIVSTDRFSDPGNDERGHPFQADSQRSGLSDEDVSREEFRKHGLAFIVADGNGPDGHLIASTLSRRAVRRFYELPGTAKDDKETFLRMQKALIGACGDIDDLRNGYLREKNQEVRAGCGFVFGLINKGSLYTVNLADVRNFVMQPTSARLKETTQEQSLVAGMERQGLLTPQQAARHPNRNIITKNLRVDPEHPGVAGIMRDLGEAFYNKVKLARGTVVLGMTDGLENSVGLSRVEAIAKKERGKASGAQDGFLQTIAGWNSTGKERAGIAFARVGLSLALGYAMAWEPGAILTGLLAAVPELLRPRK